MMMDPIETIERDDGLTIELHYDTDPESPREWCNVGTMVCWHRHYTLGDEQLGTDRFRSLEHMRRWLGIVADAAIVLPLGLIDHSGISMWVGSGAHMCDPGGWDSGQVGWIYCTREQVREEWGDGPDALTRAEACLRSEVDTYDDYLTGAVCGYIVQTQDGDCVASCWGFFGSSGREQALADAAGEADAYTAAENRDNSWAAAQGIPTVQA